MARNKFAYRVFGYTKLNDLSIMFTVPANDPAEALNRIHEVFLRKANLKTFGIDTTIKIKRIKRGIK